MTYSEQSICKSDVDKTTGVVLLEFGSNSCGHCLHAEPLITEALSTYPDITHIKIADGRGKRLGRAFQVKLWPSLIFLKDGVEVERLVRPTELTIISSAVESLVKSKPLHAP